ncbi:amidohydrolase [Altererythrobacter sp. Root672]|uniref:amidohydrolase n=1 Tax=Altererythrobacter sp. Root672 TaxID=1736584 RepID=UPI0006F335C3|nr:amidohydrolase [Altererythrobacter sp. Root672]KRA83000.1 peptidase M20 [Altererythrobacter sp. Root672]
MKKVGLWIALGLALAGTSSAQAQPADLAAARAQLDALLDRTYPELEALYRDIHAHPELAMHETRTAALLAGQLRSAGFEVTEGVGDTGIVGVFRNGDGPTILVRTELDGLPMEEKSGLPYASRTKQSFEGAETFTAHSCGHDIHMAWWVGAARALVAMKDKWHGTLLFIGQPAEENLGGARAMLADGLFERFPKPDFGFAAHVSSEPAGTIYLRSGAAGAASDSYEITFHGRGGHGSMPSATIDPIAMGAHFVSDVQTVISREKDAAAFGVLTIGAFQAGTVANIIPDDAVVKVNMRSHSPEVRSLLTDGMTRTAKAVASMARAEEPTISYLGGTAALINDASMVQQAATVLKPLYGEQVQLVPPTAPPVAASEDFSEFVSAGVPSLFFGIGGYDPEPIAQARASGTPLPVNHSPYFAPRPDPTIRAGVSAIVMAIVGGVRPETAAPGNAQ